MLEIKETGGNGILTISDRNIAQFNVLLLAYYGTGNGEPLKRFLYERAIDGMDL